MKSIDVVITWEDGSDKKYKRKIQKYLSSFGSYKKQYLEANEIKIEDVIEELNKRKK